jgi:hypothetical protein
MKSGMGGMVFFAHSFLMTIFPTIGPFPWVMITLRPADSILATSPMQASAWANCSSTVPFSPRRMMAFPPSETMVILFPYNLGHTKSQLLTNAKVFLRPKIPSPFSIGFVVMI